MNATNTLSTKSPIIWQATLHPSKLFASLYAFCLLFGLIALCLCPVHWGIRIVLVCITVAGGIVNFLATCQNSALALCEDDSWLFAEKSQQFHGVLASGSYRSMLLIVLTIKPTQGRCRHAVIWRDSVSATQFSALHIRLALTPSQQLQ